MVKNMKTTFLLIALVLSFQFEAKAEPPPPEGEKSSASNKQCSAELEKAAPYASQQGKDVAYPGSDNFFECDKMSRGHLKGLYKSSSASRSGFNWEPYVAVSCADSCGDQTEFTKCKEKYKSKAMACESVLFVMSNYDRDWNDEEQITPVKATAVGGQAQQQGATAAAAASSSAIKCKSEGIETLDYIACKKFATQLDLIDAVQTVAQGTQELVYADKMMDTQTKYAKEENSATGALKATGESLEMQQSMYQQRTAVDATKLAYLYSIYNDMPKSADIVGKCQNIGRIQNSGLGTIDTKTCQSAVRGGQGGFALAQNQSQIDAMRGKLITIATSAGSNAILSNLLGKRADDVKDAIAEIDAFVPTDPTIVSEEDALATYCKLNPGVEKCLTQDLTRTFDTLNDNIITFGDGGTGTSYGSNNSIGTGTSTSESDATTRTSVAPVGSIIAAAAKDNSIEDSSAASVSSGGGSPGGGGGGGLGGGGSGGGGGGLPSAPATGGVAAAVQGKTPTYAGGAGSISVVGGLGLNKGKGEAKADDNPFGKLFGKDNAKGSGVVNFRDIASQKVGAKGDNLFDMISKRYSSVAADKRLLEYELAK